MMTFVAMLRGINVSGQKKMPMADLRALCAALGLQNIETYVQSGNVIFDSAAADRESLGAAIEAAIERAFGYQVAVFVRDAAELQRAIDCNPFTTARLEDPARLYVTFLYRQPSEERLDALAVPPGSSDQFALAGDLIYLFCPTGYGTSKLSNTFFEKKLDVPATTRNWNTVNALYRLASSH